MAKVKYENMRSCWEFGEASECRRGLMCGMGYTEEEQKRPLIAVVNSWNEYNPGHVHLDKLAERVKQGPFSVSIMAFKCAYSGWTLYSSKSEIRADTFRPALRNSLLLSNM